MDELLDEIRQKLAKVADGVLFEEFVGHTLVGEIPGFTPVKGAGDFGRDGEAPTSKGAAPLACTIRDDVIGNMTETFNTYRRSGGEAAVGYVATSQHLTNAKKQNLRKRAKELGFVLGPIYDDEYFIIALYKDADWRKKLLGISGSLPALSKVPWSTRTTLDLPLINRHNELERLEKVGRDALISGQPGSGKTYLVDKFAKTHNALFVISNDLTRIADEVRKKSPEYLIVDDIHNKEKLLQDINNLRTQQDLEFKVIGITWSSGETNIKGKMGISDGSIVRLQELTRDDIVTVIDACGLKNYSNEIKREIVNQSKGKPGLAITLSNLCLQGDWQKVFNGDSLYDLVTTTFNARLGRDVTTLLSFIALGGNAGVDMSELAQISGMGVGDVRAILAELAFGGVISTRENGNVSIEPASLRYPLIRELFFTGAGTLKFEGYIQHYPSTSDVIESLLITALKGAKLDSSRIAPYLDENVAPVVWAYFASLGETEGEFVAQNNRQAIVKVPHPVLYRQPKIAVRELLLEAANDHRELHSYPNHPIRVLKDWAENAQPDRGDAVERRRLIVETAGELLSNNYQDEKTIGRALAAGLNPDYEQHQTDPGYGKTLTLTQGYLSPTEFKRMPTIIEMAGNMFQKLTDDAAFTELLGVAGDWVYNRRNVSAAYLSQISSVKQEAAQLLLKKLHAATTGHHLVQRHIRQLGNTIGLELRIEVPKEYEILFPFESRTARREGALFQQQMTAVKTLAQEWSKLPPEQVAKRLAELEAEARATSTNYPNHLNRLLPALCEVLPGDSLVTWAEQLTKQTPSAMLTFDIASKIASLKPEGYRDILKSMLSSKAHKVSAIQAIITQFDTKSEPELLELAKPHLSQYAQVLDTACLRGEVSTQNEIFVLDNVDEDAAITVCGGIAFQYSNEKMPEDLKDKWQGAILNHSTSSYHSVDEIERLLSEHQELVLSWFKKQLNRQMNPDSNQWLHTDTIAAKAAEFLTKAEKKALLAVMDSSDANDSLVDTLVGSDQELYQTLLANNSAKTYHLKPLSIYSENWVAMTQAALDTGYSKDDVKKRSFHFNFGWSGSAADMWRERKVQVLAHLKKTSNQDIANVVKECAENIETYIERAEQDERRDAINGL